MCNLKFAESCRSSFKKSKILTFTAIYIFECVRFLFNNRHRFQEDEPHTLYNTRYVVNYDFPSHKLTLLERGAYYSCLKFYNKLPSDMKSIADFRHLKNKLFLFLCELEPYNVGEYLSR